MRFINSCVKKTDPAAIFVRYESGKELQIDIASKNHTNTSDVLFLSSLYLGQSVTGLEDTAGARSPLSVNRSEPYSLVAVNAYRKGKMCISQ